MASKSTNLGVDAHQGQDQDQVRAHSHAPYGSQEDLEARLAAARGDDPTPQYPEPLAAPSPDGVV